MKDSSSENINTNLSITLKDLDYVGVVFLENIPSFIGVDGKNYGTFISGAKASIPFENALLLIKNHIAKIDRAWINELIKKLINSGANRKEAVAKLKQLWKEKITTAEVEVEDPIPPVFWKICEKFDEAEKIQPDKIAEIIMENHTFKTLRDTEELLIYKNGVYRFEAESIVKEETENIARMLEKRVTGHFCNEVINHIKRRTYIERAEFNKDKKIINLRNGLLNIKTLELSSHDPNHLSTIQLPVNYNPTADCPKIKKFLREVLREEDIPVIEEMIGYCLWKDYHIHKAFLLVGDGANGKSTLIRLICSLLGQENISSVSLQSLLTDRFAPAELNGKLMNAFADLPSRSLRETGIFKALTGGDPIGAQKKFKNPFTFINFAKLIFSTNTVPPTIDRSDAFFRRWMIIDFPNKFEGEKADKRILEKLTTPEELSGLLNLALNGLKRLLENGDFSRSKTTEEIAERYTKLSDPVYSFLEEKCRTGKDLFVTKEELYNAYIEYCNEFKLSPLSQRRFTERLKALVPITEYRPKGREKRCWKGIALKEIEQKTLADV